MAPGGRIALSGILKGQEGTRVVIVSVLEDGPLPKRLLEAGAAGYIGKGCDAQELLRAVRDGTVKTLHAKAGDSLRVDQKIIEFA